MRIVGQYERAAEVGLPLLEDRTEVEEHDVVVGDDPVRRVLTERLQGVLTGSHDPPMPVPRHAEQLFGQFVDLVRQVLLTDTGADHPASLDLVEELRRLVLGIKKPFRTDVFVGDRLLHSIDATTVGGLSRLGGPARRPSKTTSTSRSANSLL